MGFEPTPLYPFFQTSTRLFCCEFKKVTQQTNLPFLFVLLLYGISNEKIISEFSVNDSTKISFRGISWVTGWSYYAINTASASSKALNSASASARRSATNVSSPFKQFNTFLESLSIILHVQFGHLNTNRIQNTPIRNLTVNELRYINIIYFFKIVKCFLLNFSFYVIYCYLQ